jgi:ABC transporter substrate binding protein
VSSKPKRTGHVSPILVLVCFLAFFLPTASVAQQTTKIARIGYLSPETAAREGPRAESIRSALRELGYVEGQNLLIEYRYANGHRDRQSELAAELVRLNVDVILVTGGEPYLRGAMKATQTIPIVMTGPGPDPVEARLVKSLARPAISPELPTCLQSLAGSGWNCSRKPFPKSFVSRLSTIEMLRAPHKKSNRICQLRRARWG